MEYPAYYYLSFAAHVALWVYILFRGRHEGILACFPLFYIFVVVSGASFAAKMVAPYFLDRGTTDYSAFYFASNVPILVLATALLVQIYCLVRRVGDWTHWLALIVGFTIATCYSLFAAVGGGSFTRITSSILFFQLALCTLIVLRLIVNRELTVGRNWEAVFLGISIPNVLHAVNSAAFLFEDWWSYPLYLRLIEPLSLLSWVIMAAGMRKFHPPQVTVWAEAGVAGEVRECSG